MLDEADPSGQIDGRNAKEPTRIHRFLVGSGSSKTGSSKATWHNNHQLGSIDLLHSMMLNRRSRRRCHRHNPLLHKHSCRRCRLCSNCTVTCSAEQLPWLAGLQKSQMATPTAARSRKERTFSSEYSRKNSETKLSHKESQECSDLANSSTHTAWPAGGCVCLARTPVSSFLS